MINPRGTNAEGAGERFGAPEREQEWSRPRQKTNRRPCRNSCRRDPSITGSPPTPPPQPARSSSPNTRRRHIARRASTHPGRRGVPAGGKISVTHTPSPCCPPSPAPPRALRPAAPWPGEIIPPPPLPLLPPLRPPSILSHGRYRVSPYSLPNSPSPGPPCPALLPAARTPPHPPPIASNSRAAPPPRPAAPPERGSLSRHRRPPRPPPPGVFPPPRPPLPAQAAGPRPRAPRCVCLAAECGAQRCDRLAC